jgi:XTP/dITP diphosphohydrolase
MPADIVLPPEGTESFVVNATVKARALARALTVAGWPREAETGPGTSGAPPERETDVAVAGAPPEDDIKSAVAGDAAGVEVETDPAVVGDVIVLADDSGLEVEALAWAPGVVSSRYAGVDGDDQGNITKLLAALAPFPAPAQRRARFVCALVAIVPGVREFAVTGEWWGTIAAFAHGDGGFGYDPVFMPEGSDLSVAQWPQARKDQASHRALAGKALLELLSSEGVLHGP